MANNIKPKYNIHTPDHWIDDDLNNMRNAFTILFDSDTAQKLHKRLLNTEKLEV